MPQMRIYKFVMLFWFLRQSYTEVRLALNLWHFWLTFLRVPLCPTIGICKCFLASLAHSLAYRGVVKKFRLSKCSHICLRKKKKIVTIAMVRKLCPLPFLLEWDLVQASGGNWCCLFSTCILLGFPWEHLSEPAELLVFKGKLFVLFTLAPDKYLRWYPPEGLEQSILTVNQCCFMGF